MIMYTKRIAAARASSRLANDSERFFSSPRYEMPTPCGRGVFAMADLISATMLPAGRATAWEYTVTE